MNLEFENIFHTKHHIFKNPGWFYFYQNSYKYRYCDVCPCEQGELEIPTFKIVHHYTCIFLLF